MVIPKSSEHQREVFCVPVIYMWANERAGQKVQLCKWPVCVHAAVSNALLDTMRSVEI